MVTLLKNNTLGMGNQFAPTQCCWIATAIGAGVSLASSILGGKSASDAAKAAEARQRALEAKENAWYLRNYNQNTIDTAAGQNLLNRAKEFARDNWRKAAGAQAVAGGTDAAVAQAKDQGNKMVGETISNIAAMDVQRKQNVDAAHMQSQMNFGQMDINRENQRAQNIANAAGQASNAIMSVATAFDEPKVNLKGSKNG